LTREKFEEYFYGLLKVGKAILKKWNMANPYIVNLFEHVPKE
jgi:hypothetical protein